MQGRSPCHVRPGVESGVWGRLHLHLAANPGYDSSVYLRFWTLLHCHIIQTKETYPA
jgi:hypothetical protein